MTESFVRKQVKHQNEYFSIQFFTYLDEILNEIDAIINSV